MKTFLALLTTLSALGLTALLASAAETRTPVVVSYPDADKYSDFKSDPLGGDADLASLEAEFAKHLTKVAGDMLAAGQRLEVKFTDIDLAGAFEPWRGAQFDHIRIMKDIYPPRMTLEFRLLGADGKVISEGKRDLVNLAYQMQTLFPTSDGLRYDKQLLTEWVRAEFRKK